VSNPKDRKLWATQARTDAAAELILGCALACSYCEDLNPIEALRILKVSIAKAEALLGTEAKRG